MRAYLSPASSPMFRVQYSNFKPHNIRLASASAGFVFSAQGFEASVHDHGLHCRNLFSADHGETGALLFLLTCLVADGSGVDESGDLALD